MATDPSEHSKIILAAIIPGRRDLLDQAIRQLVAEHFTEQTHTAMFQMLVRYIEVAGAVLPRKALSDILLSRNLDPARVMLYEELYDSFAAQQVADSDFLWSLQQVREMAAERATAEALTVGMEVLRHGTKETKGIISQGHQDARGAVL